MTPAGTSNELDVQNKWEENTHNTEQVEGSDLLKNKDTNATQSGIRDTPVYDNIVSCEAKGLVLPGWAASDSSDGRKT